MSNYRTDEQQREVDLQGWWNACEKKDAEIERQRKEITKLRRKNEALRKRLEALDARKGGGQ